MIMTNLKSVFVNGCPIDWRSINPPNDKFSTNKKANNKDNPLDLILIIPGNPGLVSYYEEFADRLYKLMDEKTAVWSISHGCHSILNYSNTSPDYSCCLKSEIDQKVEFIKRYVPNGSNLTLIGHSIGCYMIIKALKQMNFDYTNSQLIFDDDEFNHVINLKKCYLLFPTINHMKASPSGIRLWPILKYFRWFVLLLVFFVYLLPNRLKYFILRMKFNNYNYVSKCCYEATIQLVCPRLINNVLLLAYDELCTVTELDVNLINNLKEHLVFYYGIKDNWCPLIYHDLLKQNIPKANTHICKLNIEHAFVIESSNEMADVTAKFIKNE